jgi:hypothetical protein
MTKAELIATMADFPDDADIRIKITLEGVDRIVFAPIKDVSCYDQLIHIEPNEIYIDPKGA